MTELVDWVVVAAVAAAAVVDGHWHPPGSRCLDAGTSVVGLLCVAAGCVRRASAAAAAVAWTLCRTTTNRV